MHCSASDRRLSKTGETYHKTKREHIRGRVHFSRCVRLWTSPHPTSNLSSLDNTILGYIGRILNVRNLHLLHCYLATPVLPFYQDVVRLDIGMNNSFIMQSSDSTQGISENSLGYGKRNFILDKRQKVVSKVLVYEHGFVGAGIIRHA